MWASAGVSLSACCMPSWCKIINEFWCKQKWPSIPNKQKGLGLWHLRALTLRLHGSPYCTSHKTNIKKKYQKNIRRVSHANNVLPFVCVAGSKAVLIDCNRRKLRFCFLDQSRDIRFCLNYLGSISSQMDSTTWKAWCISRLSKQLVGEAKLTKTYAQRCYYRLDPSFTRNCQKQDSSKTVAVDHNFHVECNDLKIVYSSMAPCSSEELCPPQDCRPQPGTKTKHLLRASRVEQKWTCDAFKLHTDSYRSSMLYWECGNHIWRFRLDLNLQSLSCFNVK